MVRAQAYQFWRGGKDCAEIGLVPAIWRTGGLREA
jgi:hypothetical protein